MPSAGIVWLSLGVQYFGFVLAHGVQSSMQVKKCPQGSQVPFSIAQETVCFECSFPRS